MTILTNNVQVSKAGIVIDYTDNSGAAVSQTLSFANKTLSVNSGFNVSSGDASLAGALNVAGVSNLNNALNVSAASALSGSMAVTGVSNLNNTLNVSGVSNLNNALNVAGASALASSLAVTGAANLNGALNVLGASALSGSLAVAGTTNLNNSLNVSGAAALNNSLAVTGTTTLNNTLDVTGASRLRSTLLQDGAATLGNTLTVTGASVLNNNTTINGTTALNGALTVSGASSLGGALNVTGATSLSSALDVTGATHLLNTVIVDQAATLGSSLAVAGATNMNGVLNVLGASHLSSTLLADGAATLGSSLAVAGAANMSDVLNVVGASHLSSTLLVDQAATLGSSIAVSGASNLNGVLNVTGASHLSSTLLVDQAATLGSSIAVAGASNLNGVLNVTGASALNSTLAVTGAATMNDTLAVADATTLGGAFSLTGAATFNNTLNVTGAATFQQNATINGNLTVLGSQTAIDTTSLQVKDNAILVADNNTADTLESGIMVQYKPSGASAPKYAGVKRRPVAGSAGGEFVFFKDADSQISVTESSNSSSILYSNVRQYPPSALSASSTTLTNNSYGNGTYVISCSSELNRPDWGAYELAYKAFDYSLSNSFWTTGGNNSSYDSNGIYNNIYSTIVSGTTVYGEWLQIALPVSIVLSNYTLYPWNNDPSRMPKNFIIAGSTNGSLWTLLDTQNNNTNWTSSGKSFSSSNLNTLYNYYRIIILSNNGGGLVTFGEWVINGKEIQESSPLYSFTDFTFTPNSATGRYGPTALTYNTATYPWITSYLALSSGIQQWTVPKTGTYTLTAAGAKGGNNSGGQQGANGIIVSNIVSLTKNDIVYILVGQLGTNGTGGNGAAGGGGGGTFVVKYNGGSISSANSYTILLIAGGGGGAGWTGTPGKGVITTSGSNDSGNASIGGSNGNGGSSGGAVGGGAAGGGFLTNGYATWCSAATGTCEIGVEGQSFLNNGFGGRGGSNTSNLPGQGGAGGVGGGGGGGANCWSGGGGGGGYSGGGAGQYVEWWASTSGGGGGSYDINGPSRNATSLGYNSGNGYAMMTFISSTMTNPVFTKASGITNSFGLPTSTNYSLWTSNSCISNSGQYAVIGFYDTSSMNDIGGLVYYSTNYGVTWAQSNVSGITVRGLAMSGDGTKVVFGNPLQTNSPCYYSIDSGKTFTRVTNIPTVYYFNNMVISDDGTTIAVCGVGTNVYLSKNSGSTWTTLSVNGGYIIANGTCSTMYVVGGSSAYVTTNTGTTWTTVSGLAGVSGIGGAAMSKDGTKILVPSSTGVYFSTNSGTSFSVISSLPTSTWNSSTGVSISYDAKIMAVGNSGPLYMSFDSGSTWAIYSSGTIPNPNGSFQSIAVQNNLMICNIQAVNGGIAQGNVYIATAPPVATSSSDVYAVVIADSFNCASDLKLKNKIVPLDNVLDKLDAIRGVYHDWIDNNQSYERQIGVIAQEIQAVYPELVTVSGNGYLSVNYPKLTSVLLECIKELKAKAMELLNKKLKLSKMNKAE